MNRRPSGTTSGLIALLGGSGLLHFLKPAPFIGIVPKVLPRKRELVYLSGGAELIAAALMVAPVTRRLGGAISAALLIAVFPANVSMALSSDGRPWQYRVVAWARLPLQVPLIRWAWRTGRES